MSFQQITVVGHAGADAEMRYTPSGVPVASFSIASSRKWKNAQGVEQEATTWHRVTAWRKLAEVCGEHVHRGDRLLVTGTVEARAFLDNRTGEPRAALEVTADTLRFLGGAHEAEQHRPTGATPRSDEQHSTFVPASVDMMREQEIPF